MDKYYTPEINEFYVGFEYEVSLESNRMSIFDASKGTVETITPHIKGWENTSVRFDIDFPTKMHRDLSAINKMLISGNIRVKYLDKEDIESLGFEYSGLSLFRYKGYRLTRIGVDNKITIEKLDKLRTNIIFLGYIKNKSEFKILLKRLNISDII